MDYTKHRRKSPVEFIMLINPVLLFFKLITKNIPTFCLTFIAIALFISSSSAKTRWSSVQLIPDADFLAGGQYVIGAPCFFTKDTPDVSVFKPAAKVNIGLIEWVNLEAGYTGGAYFGFKARVLGETHPAMPSLAVGSKNIITNEEVYYFSRNSKEKMTNEFFLVLGKSIDPLKTRLHLGLQSIPAEPRESINPYFGIEKYFGSGLYFSFEMHRRDLMFHPSLFISYRFLKQKLEFCVGFVELKKMLFDDKNNFSISLSRPTGSGFVKPGIWLGIRFCGNFTSGRSDGLTGLEDRLSDQQKEIKRLNDEVTSLRSSVDDNKVVIGKIKRAVKEMVDTSQSPDEYIKATIVNKLISLHTLYTTVPFEPEKARTAIADITGFRIRALPPLKEIALDEKEDRNLRLLALSLIGEIGDPSSSDALLDVLGKSGDPDYKVEALIALGKMQETRALYAIEQLVNDPNDAVAFTAQEVLQKLRAVKGIKSRPDLQMRKVTMPEGSSVAGLHPGITSRPIDTTAPAPAAPVSPVPVAPITRDTIKTIKTDTTKALFNLAPATAPAAKDTSAAKNQAAPAPAAQPASAGSSTKDEKEKKTREKKPAEEPPVW